MNQDVKNLRELFPIERSSMMKFGIINSLKSTHNLSYRRKERNYSCIIALAKKDRFGPKFRKFCLIIIFLFLDNEQRKIRIMASKRLAHYTTTYCWAPFTARSIFSKKILNI